VTRLAPSLRILRSQTVPVGAAFVLFAASAGALWGLSLSRALAETFPKSPTYGLGPTLLLVLGTAAAVGGLVWWFLRRRSGRWEDGYNAGLVSLPLLLSLIYLFWPRVAPLVGWTLLGGSLMLAILLTFRQARSLSVSYSLVAANVLVFVVLMLYLFTLGPTVGQADTFEFQVVAPTLGIAHPTGYPLYILSGKIFSLLPFGSVAWRINLTSAVFGVGAVAVLYLLIHWLTGRALLALVAALALAFSRVFWSQAVVAEVYTLHNMLVAAVLLLLVMGVCNRWWQTRTQDQARQETRAADALDRLKRALNPVYLLALLLGLGLANHLTTVLLLPAVLLTLLLVRPRLNWREWLVVVGLFLLGVALYGYIYLRWPALHDGVWMSPGAFWRYITGQQFGGALRLDAWRTDSTRYEIVSRLLREPFGWPGLALGAVGLIWLGVRNWRVAVITAVTFLAFAWYALSYYVPDVSVFLLPAHLVLAIWLGVGIAAVLAVLGYLARSLGWLEDVMSLSRFRAWGYAAVISLFALLPLWLLWSNLPHVDQSGQRDGYIWGDRVLALPLARDAAILADSVRIAPLYYLQRIEGRRPDLDLLVLADEATYRAELAARLDAGQTVYLARYLPGLEGLYHLRALGPLTEVSSAPMSEVPQLDGALGVMFNLADQGRSLDGTSSQELTAIELIGFTGPAPGPEGGTGVTLYWRTAAPVGENLHVRLRLVDSEGQVWWQDEGRHAANDYYPTLAWRPGEVVADFHEIPALSGGPNDTSGRFSLQVGLFQPFSEQGLLTEAGEFWYPLTDLDLATMPDDSAPQHPLLVRFSLPSHEEKQRDGDEAEFRLRGVDMPDVLPAGAPWELRLHSVSEGAGSLGDTSGDAAADMQLVLTWTDQHGSSSVAPILESWDWSRFSLQAPDSPGDYGLWLGMVDGQGRAPPAYCGWLARATESCRLATVRVTETSKLARANFDGRMLLLDADITLAAAPDGSASALAPGQSIPVILYWQGLQAMDENYTVSVQLVGPDGRLRGQMDAWPVQGTLPTSQWQPGQHITDPYQVVLASDAPAGRYQVGVVVYLLETQSRLPLVDDSGQVTGDIAWLGDVEVVTE
jgi:hypothetical protein